MNSYEKDIKDRLDKMTLAEAKEAVYLGNLPGIDIGSPHHDVAVSLLKDKESKIKDARERKILLWSIISAIAAVLAAIFAFIGLLL